MHQTLLDPPASPVEQKISVSPVRFYCLVLASLLAGFQGAFWNNFGPISQAVQPFYGWSSSTIALLSNWGPIAYLLAAAPAAWLLDHRDFKTNLVTGAALTFAGAVCRLYVAPTAASAVCMHVGQFINAIAGPWAMSIGPPLSAAWFAPRERTFSTAVVGAVNYGFVAITFSIGPVLVPAGRTLGETRSGLTVYMVGQAVASGLLLLCALLVPPRRAPPSRSATTARMSMRKGVVELARRPAFWCLSLCYGSMTGFSGAWGSMLGPNMATVLPADEAEVDAAWLGFWGALAGMLGGVVMGLCADRLGRKKPLLLGCCAGGCLTFGLFAALCGPVPMSDAKLLPWMYFSSISGTLLVQTTVPLFLELSVEAMFPVAEGLVTAALTTVCNAAMIVFLLVPNFTPATLWMNWAVAGSCLASLLALVPLEEQQRRLALDLRGSSSSSRCGASLRRDSVHDSFRSDVSGVSPDHRASPDP